MATQLDTPPPPPTQIFTLTGPGGTMTLDRQTIETLADAFVAMLDVGDPDPDLGDNGDELDFNAAEDDFVNHNAGWTAYGAGCPLSDPGGCEHDGRELEDGY